MKTQTQPDYAALVALDWGDTTHAFAWQKSDDQKLFQGKLSATPEALHAWLEQLREACGGRPVALAVEAGRNGLMHALLEHAWLTIYPIHPTTSARFRLAFAPSGAKDDGPDAEVILALLRQHRERLAPFRPDTPATRELAALVEHRRGAVDQRTALINQLLALLKRVYPQALSLIGEDPAAPLALAFLRRFPSLAAAQKAGGSRLREFYRKHNVRSAERIEQRVTLVAKARAITTDEAILRPAALELPRLLDLLEVLARHIVAHDKAIAQAFAAHPKAEIFAALPGAGPVLAPRLLTLFGERDDRYPDAASLQKYAGVAPVRERSQGRLWVHWRWAAPKFLRQSLVEWAGQTVPRCAWAKEYYLKQKAAGKGHHAILRALAFKWVRILWRCWKDNVPYDEARYLATLAKRAAPSPRTA
jgi:transposase